jgi:hypothetical protein
VVVVKGAHLDPEAGPGTLRANFADHTDHAPPPTHQKRHTRRSAAPGGPAFSRAAHRRCGVYASPKNGVGFNNSAVLVTSRFRACPCTMHGLA